MRGALAGLKVEGPTTTAPFHDSVLAHDDFVAGASPRAGSRRPSCRSARPRRRRPRRQRREQRHERAISIALHRRQPDRRPGRAMGGRVTIGWCSPPPPAVGQRPAAIEVLARRCCTNAWRAAKTRCSAWNLPRGPLPRSVARRRRPADRARAAGCRRASTDGARLWLTELAAARPAEVVLIDPLLDLVRIKAGAGSCHDGGLTAIAALPYTAETACPTKPMRAQRHARRGRRRPGDAARRERGADTGPAAHPAAGAGVGARRHAARPAPALPDGARARGRPRGRPPRHRRARHRTALGRQRRLPAVAAVADPRPATRRRQGLPDLDALWPPMRCLPRSPIGTAFPRQRPWPFDLAPYVHQLPGEVAADVRSGLRERGRWADLHAFADECAAVRSEVGSPPMLAPFARAIAEQALCHCGAEPRYETLRPVLRRLLQGVYGTVNGDQRVDLQARVGSVLTSELGLPDSEAISLPMRTFCSRGSREARSRPPAESGRASPTKP